MEQFNNLVRQANNSFKTADHLTYVTYSLLKDQKLMLPIIQNLYNASASAIGALLYYEKVYKRLDTLPLDIDSRIRVFETSIGKRHNLSQSIARVVRELKFILEQHRSSPVEFMRRDRLVICNEDYSKVDVINIIRIKEYIKIVKELVGVLNTLKC